MTPTNSSLSFPPTSQTLDAADTGTASGSSNTEPGRAQANTTAQQERAAPSAVLGRLADLNVDRPQNTTSQFRPLALARGRRNRENPNALRLQAMGQSAPAIIPPRGAAPTKATPSQRATGIASPPLIPRRAAAPVTPTVNATNIAGIVLTRANWNSLNPLNRIKLYKAAPKDTPNNIRDTTAQQVLTDIARAVVHAAAEKTLSSQDAEQVFKSIIMTWSGALPDQATFLEMLANEASKALTPSDLQSVHGCIINHWPANPETKTAVLTSRLIDQLNLTDDPQDAFSRLLILCEGEPPEVRPFMYARLFKQLSDLQLGFPDNEDDEYFDEDREFGDEATHFFSYASDLEVRELRQLLVLIDAALERWPETGNRARVQSIADELHATFEQKAASST